MGLEIHTTEHACTFSITHSTMSQCLSAHNSDLLVPGSMWKATLYTTGVQLDLQSRFMKAHFDYLTQWKCLGMPRCPVTKTHEALCA